MNYLQPRVPYVREIKNAKSDAAENLSDASNAYPRENENEYLVPVASKSVNAAVTENLNVFAPQKLYGFAFSPFRPLCNSSVPFPTAVCFRLFLATIVGLIAGSQMVFVKLSPVSQQGAIFNVPFAIGAGK